MSDDFQVVVSAGSLRSESERAVRFPHRWTPDGVTVETEFTGAHLLHLAAAGCVLNDMYREALSLDLALDGVRVSASGGFETSTWTSTGIGYAVEVDTHASAADVERLLDVVDGVAEIPRALRSATVVRRTTAPGADR